MGVGQGKGDGPEDVSAIGKKKRMGIPALPMPLAVICCILNFIVPGQGTIIGGFCVFCCARNEDMTCGEMCCSCTASVCLGLLQLVCTPILLLGWIWSCVWGVMFIGMSKEYYHHNPVYRRPATDVVVTQPSSGGQQYGTSGQQFGTSSQQYVPPSLPYGVPVSQYGYGQQQSPMQYGYGQHPAPSQPPGVGHQYIPPHQPQTVPQPQGVLPEKPPAYEDNRPEPTAPVEPPPPYSPT